MKQKLIIIALIMCGFSAVAQERIAVKTNLLYGATTLTPNLGVEVGLGKHTTIDIAGGYNWFNLDGAKNNNKKLVHWMVQPEFRYFLAERFNGHYFGVHGIASMYNIGGYNLPMLFGKDSQNYRHEGSAYGVGFSYGYQYMLSERWNIAANIGAGYMNMNYDRYNCRNCGGLNKEGVTKNYFGITKAGISIIYIIK